MTESLQTACPPSLRPSWVRPVLMLALGLLGLGSARAQLQPAGAASRAQAREILAGTAASLATQPLVPSAAAQRPTAAISSTATGGNWSAPGTWVGGVVPTASDDVTIGSGATVTLDVAAVAGSLTVATNGTLVTSATTAYSLQIGGSVTNNGTLTLSANSTIGSDLRFVGAGSVTFGGTGTTDLFTMSLAKSVLADVVDMNLPILSVKGTAASTTGFLFTRTTGTTPADDMTGTLKISGTATITNRVFGNAAAYIIPTTGAFWLTNPNYTVSGQNGTPNVNGQLRLTAGTYNVGTSTGNSILFGTGSVLTVEGGTLNSTGRVGNFTGAAAVPGAMTFTLSSGTINVATIGNASGTPSFGIAGNLAISGGTVNLVQRSTATTPLDYYVALYSSTNTQSITGGTVNVGTAATATNFDFRLRGTVPNLTVDNTTNAKSALLANQLNVSGTVTTTVGSTLNLNGYLLLQGGPAIVNNGTLTGSTAGSTLYFQGAVAQTLSGTGTFTILRTLSVDNSSTAGVTLTVPLVVYRVNMFTGNLVGTSNLTIGDGTLVIFVVQIGVAGNTNTSGSFASAPTFNIGIGGYSLVYALEATARTTGFEIPATRVVDAVSISNTNGVTLAGGNLTINTSAVTTGTLTLTSGILTTSATNTVIIGTGATTFPTGSATAYVRGPEGIIVNSTTAVSRTFAVGDATGWRPVVVGGITTSSAQTFTATVVNGATGGSVTGALSSLNPTRYVRLQNTANLPASATVQLSYGADDVVGGTATAVVAQAPTAAGAYASRGGATATTPTTGIVSTQPITPGNDFFVLANTEGGTLTSSVTTGCAGATSGTLTLSGNATGSTVVKYQADTGSGFVDVTGTNTGLTYTFTNLTATTTFRVVLTTSDGRTVNSAPVTVTVTPMAASGFSYPTGPYCVSGTTSPTPTITGAAGGTFSTTTGLAINATTGVITLGSSTAGTYTVTYTVAGACGSSSTQSIAINAAPTAGFSYAAGPYCVSGTTNPTVTLATGATAGTFSSTTGLTINATTGVITLSSSTAGTYTVTNTVAATGGCAAVTSTATFILSGPSTATFSYIGSPFCKSGTNPTPSITGTTGGTFSSTTGLSLNASTGVINLSASTAGTYTVTYTLAGTCGSNSTQSVTITNPSTAGFSYPTATSCAGTSTTLTPTPATGATAGTFTLPAATGLSINATTGVVTVGATAAAGTYTVTNTVAASGGCAAASSTASFVLSGPSTATFSYSGSPFCTSGTTITPTITGTAGGTFSTTTGLSLNATTGVITPSTSPPGTYAVTYTVAGTCGSSSTQSVTITAPQTAGFSYAAGPYCVSGTTNPTVALATGATAGTFSSTTGLTINAATGAITLSNSTPGTYTVTNMVAASGGCAATTSTATITITAAPTAGFSYPTPAFGAACVGSANTFAPILATGATGGIFTTTSGLSVNPTTGVINLASPTIAGSYLITNTVRASGGCAAVTSAASFTVSPVPAIPIITVSGSPATGITLTSSPATGYLFYLNGIAIPSSAGQQTYLVDSGTKNGSYTVTVFNNSYCTATSAPVLVTVTGTAPAQAGTSLALYPNPTRDGNLNLELIGYREAVQLTVTNALGQRVYEGTVAIGQLTQLQALHLAHLPTGLYVLQARTANGALEVRRFVRE